MAFRWIVVRAGYAGTGRRLTPWLLAALLTCVVPAAYSQPRTPVINTIAGGGDPAGNGDDGPALNARLESPYRIAVDVSGNVYVAEQYKFTVRKIDVDGIISTVAGNGTQAYNGDGILATSAGIDVRDIAVDGNGNLYIADGANGRIRKVSTAGVIATVASTGLRFPSSLAVTPTGDVYVADFSRILRIRHDGTPEVVAGTGEFGESGDGGRAVRARLGQPHSLAADQRGNLYFADIGRVRRIDSDGVISTVAGGGAFRIDPLAKSIRMLRPEGVVVDSRGNVYVGGEGPNAVIVINPAGAWANAAGQMRDEGGGFAGGRAGFSGDGGAAVNALFDYPSALAMDSEGNLFIADMRNHRIRKVTPVPSPAVVPGANAFRSFRMQDLGAHVQHVATADINGDGRTDIVLVTVPSYPEPDPTTDMRTFVFLQREDGTLATPMSHPFAPIGDGRSGSGLATGDLNADGFDDVIVGTLDGVTVFRGAASGFSSGTTYRSMFPYAESTSSVALLDVDRDGRMDIVTISAGRKEGGSSPSDKLGRIVYFGNGAGGVSRQAFAELSRDLSPHQMRASDVNGDGLTDLVHAWTGAIDGYERGGVDVMLHDGLSGLRAPSRLIPARDAWWGRGWALGDFDSDGRQDVMLSYEMHVPQAGYARFKQLSGGGFAEQAELPAYDHPSEMIGGDMNGDGRDDLLVIHYSPDTPSIGYHEQTHSGLAAEVKYSIPVVRYPAGPVLAIGDVNGDACQDIVLAGGDAGLILMHGRKGSNAGVCVFRERSNGSMPLSPSGDSGAPAGELRRIHAVSVNSGRPSAAPGSRVGADPISRVAERESTRATRNAPISLSTSRTTFLIALLGFFGLLSWAWWIRVR